MSGGFGVNIGGCTPKIVAVAVLTIAVVIAMIEWTVLGGATPTRATMARDTIHALSENLCPWTFDHRAGIPPRTRADRLVPPGAIGAIVCTYTPHADAETAPLTAAMRLKRPVGEMATALNNLPTGPLGPLAQVLDPATGAIPASACGLLDQESYAIVFLYPGDAPVIVWVYAGCGVVARGGDVRIDLVVSSE